MATNLESLMDEKESSQSQPVHTQKIPPTTYSLLDMDLCEFSEFVSTLHSQNTTRKDNRSGNGGCQTEILSSKETSSDSAMQQQLHKMAEEQKHHQQELKENMEQSKREITAHTEHVIKALTDLFQEQQKEMVKRMDKQLEYLRTQFNATLGWRLQHHHTDLSKDLCSVLTPMSEVVTHLQEELSCCKKTIQSLSEELTTTKLTTAVDHTGVQTHSEGFLGEKPFLISN